MPLAWGFEGATGGKHGTSTIAIACGNAVAGIEDAARVLCWLPCSGRCCASDPAGPLGPAPTQPLDHEAGAAGTGTRLR
jgi:hypothetical protein